MTRKQFHALEVNQIVNYRDRPAKITAIIDQKKLRIIFLWVERPTYTAMVQCTNERVVDIIKPCTIGPTAS